MQQHPAPLPAAVPEPRRPRRAHPRWRLTSVCAVLFVALVALYHANTTVLEEGDAVPSLVLPLSIVKYGTPTFDPERWPEMFKWKTLPPLQPIDDFFFRDWSVRYGGKTARQLYQEGSIQFAGPRYYIVESTTHRGQYVSTFGIIPGLVALPITAALYAVDHRLDQRFVLRLSLAKLHGSLMVAGVVVALFLIASRFTSRRRALLLACLYGAGTCAFAVSSQSLWQQTVNQLFLAIGACAFLRPKPSPDAPAESNVRRIVVAGFFFGAATACRSTSLIVLVAIAATLLRHERKRLVAFTLGAAPLPLLIAAYNHYFFGSPLSFGQEVVGHEVALQKTGSPELWQTPLHEGALGLLFSPARGLMVFSPILALSFWGMARIFRQPTFGAFRPLVVASGAIMALQCLWFDWWGGWAFGYRPWLDVVPFLSLFVLPVLDSALASRARRTAFTIVFTYSVAVQILGALSYDRSWNLRYLHVVRVPGRLRPIGAFTYEDAQQLVATKRGRYIGPTYCDIDSRPCRHRLWLLRDSPIVYHLTHFSETRGRRKRGGWSELASPDDAHASALRAHVQ